jgi:hypothetical protein
LTFCDTSAIPDCMDDLPVPSQQEVSEFQQLYFERLGQELTSIGAKDMATRFLNSFGSCIARSETSQRCWTKIKNGLNGSGNARNVSLCDDRRRWFPTTTLPLHPTVRFHWCNSVFLSSNLLNLFFVAQFSERNILSG